MRPTEIAWAAGLIDGEGSIGITRDRHKQRPWNYRPRVRVSMTSLKAIERLQIIFQAGQITRLVRPDGRRDCYNWFLQNQPQLLQVLKAIGNHLVVKQWECALALALIKPENRLSQDDKAAIFDACKVPKCRKRRAA